MSRAKRHSRRQQEKARRKAQRRKNRRDRNGKKAGSISISSRLPGLEGTELGSMDVVVDKRRAEQHKAMISVIVHHRADGHAVVWSIETGFGGCPPQVGYQILPDGTTSDPPPICWFPAVNEESLLTPVIDMASAEAAGAEAAGMDPVGQEGGVAP